jgi:hypothetical protein
MQNSWLEKHSEPWSEVCRNWKESYVARKNITDKMNIFEICKLYPCLSNPDAYQLVIELNSKKIIQFIY